MVFNKNLMDNFFQNLYRKFENRVAFHHHERTTIGLATAEISWSRKYVAVAPVSMQVAGNDTRLGASGQYHRSRTVPEEHACATVCPVEYARINFSANHQGSTTSTGANIHI